MEHAGCYRPGNNRRRRDWGGPVQRSAVVFLRQNGCLCNRHLGFSDGDGLGQFRAAQAMEGHRGQRLKTRAKVVITHRVHAPVKQLLAEHYEVVANNSGESWPPAKLLEQARDAVGLLVFMPDKIGDAFLEHCPKLRVIAAALKGYDNIDAAACTRRGVWVTIVPDLLSQPTAELALALILGLNRNVVPGDRLVRSGKIGRASCRERV